MTYIATTDYFYEIGRRNVPDQQSGLLIGINYSVGSTGTEIVTDQGGDLVYLTTDTPLFVSSDSVADTDVDITVAGLDDTYTELTTTANTNGQNQVQLSEDMFRAFVAQVASTSSNTPAGNLYIAEADTLTNGIPDDLTKIKLVIPLSKGIGGTLIDQSSADYRSDNSSHFGGFTVPAGKTMRIVDIVTGTGKNNDARIGGRTRLFGSDIWYNRNPITIYQQNERLSNLFAFIVPEKTDLEFRVQAGSAGSLAQIIAFYSLETNS